MEGFSQLEDWSVCQTCGRVAARGTMHWLDLPDKRGPWRVVRCPLHWTDDAIRHTALGRSNDGRRRMRMAKEFAELHPERFSTPPWVEPFPRDDILQARKLEELRGKAPIVTQLEFNDDVAGRWRGTQKDEEE